MQYSSFCNGWNEGQQIQPLFRAEVICPSNRGFSQQVFVYGPAMLYFEQNSDFRARVVVTRDNGCEFQHKANRG